MPEPAAPTINLQPPAPSRPFSPFVLGFRPFFLAAALFSILSMTGWLLVYAFGLTLPLQGVSPFHWHAHEMIYGYALAVVSGFLLTAVKNWTGVQTLQDRPLMLLVALWAGARLALLAGTPLLAVAALCDLAFNLLLFLALFQPVIRVRQWQQIGILSKVLLLGVCNGLFYLGLFGIVEQGVYWGTQGGVFLLLALVMTLGRRVLPFFIEKGVGYPVQLRNSKWVDNISLVLFLALSVNEILYHDVRLSSYLAVPLVAVSLLRLYWWHTPGIWKKPLLWGLYVAFLFLIFGFLLFAIHPYSAMLSRSLAVHALTLGGIGLITVSMMSRVTLGHTGRSVHTPTPWIAATQWLIVLAALVRLFPPLLWSGPYGLWVLLSQLLWLGAFMVFTVEHYRMLTSPRVDGAVG